METIGSVATQAIPHFIELVRGIGPDSPTINVVHAWAATAALAAIGTAANGAISVLRDCVGLDGSGDELIRLVRLSAAEAIWRISGDTGPALRVAREMLCDDEATVRCNAADLLRTVSSEE